MVAIVSIINVISVTPSVREIVVELIKTPSFSRGNRRATGLGVNNLALMNDPDNVVNQLSLTIPFMKELCDKSDGEISNDHHNRGQLMTDYLGRYEDALAAHDEAIRLDPQDSIPHIGRGTALGRLGRPEEALAAFDEAIQLDPQNSIPLNGRALVLGSLGRHKEALTAFDEAIRLDPDDSVGHNSRGAALGSLGRYEEAIAAFDEANRLDLEDSIPYKGPGTAPEGLGRHDSLST